MIIIERCGGLSSVGMFSLCFLSREKRGGAGPPLRGVWIFLDYFSAIRPTSFWLRARKAVISSPSRGLADMRARS